MNSKSKPAPSASLPGALERDLLLSSAGELPWWRRPLLSRRVNRDAQARRLAETLSLLDLCVGVRPEPRSRVQPVLMVLAAAALLLLGLGQLFRSDPGPAPRPVLRASLVDSKTPAEPLCRVSRRLLLKSVASVPKTGPALHNRESVIVSGATGRRPPMPIWSRLKARQSSILTFLTNSVPGSRK